jgi:membrane-bound metal-dependent hydrolase YbcI (DUF457 family)
MKRVTHITTGAAIALPVAAMLSPAAAAGAIFLGMAGAVVPDYADLRSDLRRVLRHRGVSHSMLFAGVTMMLVYVIMTALTQVADPRFQLHRDLVAPLLLAFGLGLASHLVLDSATPSGIRPLLPLWDFRLRILPPGMRITTGGRIDGLVHTITSLIVTLGLLYLVYEHVR